MEAEGIPLTQTFKANQAMFPNVSIRLQFPRETAENPSEKSR